MRVSFFKLARAIGIFLGWGGVALGAAAWTAQTSGTTQDLWSICTGPGQAVAVGTGGTVLTSADGTTWTAQNSGTSVWLVAVTYSARLGLYAAVGDQGVILTSPDGVSWTQRAAGGVRLNGIAASNDPSPPASEPAFVAVGESGTMLSSKDGLTWAAGNSGVTGWLHGVAYAGNNFLMVGQNAEMQLSADGLTAQPLNPAIDRDIEAAAGEPYFAVAAGANGYIGWATPGPWSWTRFLAPGAPHFQGLADATSAGEYVAVGLQGVVDLGYRSQGTLNWTPSGSGTNADLYAVVWFAGSSGTRAIAVGQGGTILTAPEQPGPPSSAGITSTATPADGSPVTLVAQPPAGIAPFAYQWSFNGQAIAGATSPSYTIPSASLASNGQYSLTITNAVGSQTLSSTVAATPQAAIPGLVDESFNPPALSTPPLTVAVQPDGKVLVGGNSVSRLNVDGTQDTAFTQSASALSINDEWGVEGGFNTVLQQPNGQLVLTGSGVSGGTAKTLYTLSGRLNPDGTQDKTYTPTLMATGGAQSDVDLPQVQAPDGRYFTVVLSSSGLPMITRLTAQGAIDSTWTAYAPPGAFRSSVARLQPDQQGRMLMVAEDYSLISGPAGQTFVCRLNPDGSFDSSFAAQTFAGGVSLFPLPSGAMIYMDWRTPSGLSGNGVGTLTVGRLTVAGSKDSAYAGLTLPVGTSSPTTQPSWAVGPEVLASDGSFYVDLVPANVGSVPMPLLDGTYRQGFVRLDPNGQLDLSYSLNVDLRSSDNNSRIMGVAVAPSGQWVVWGDFTSFNAEAHTDLVRINPQAGANFAGLVNLSARAAAAAGNQALAVGFVTNGSNPTGMLLRGIGPGLAPFGVTGVMADPRIQLYDGNSALVATDDNWQDGGQGPAIATAAQAVGAFALPDGSPDAALLVSVPGGSHSVVVSGGSGNAMAEAYDTDSGPPTFAGNRAVNFSFRGPVGSGSAVLTAGFVVSGGNTRRVLIRAVGPGLVPLGITGTVGDPELTVFSGSNPIAQNLGWNNDATLAQTFGAVGAFSLPANSADAAMVMTLAPGAYTIQAASRSGGSGIALVEVYEVP